jgi:hypothetical protein
MSGAAGVGKTTAAMKMPKPYVIDTERGSVHYGDLIEASEGAVFESSSPDEVIREVRSLIADDHPYLTLVIDSVTPLWQEAVEEGEAVEGSEWGRHYAHAGKVFKRLFGLLMNLDMNVIVTAHEKNEYGDEMKVVGKTFDGWKKLDYAFDLWLQLDRERGNPQRSAFVAKTRLAAFPDGETFPWSYESIAARYGAEKLERGVESVTLASPEQAQELRTLLARLRPDEIKSLRVDKAMAGYDDPEDLPADKAERALEFIRVYLRGPQQEVA